MRKVLFILILLFLGFAFSQPDEKSADDSKSGTVMDNIKTDIQLFKDNKDLQNIITGVMEEAQNWADQLLLTIGQYTGERNSPEDTAEKPVLEAPEEQTFSIHNIEIGDDKAEIEKNLGPSIRISANEYGTDWHAYHDHYQNFVMVAYDKQEKAAGIYTNQDLISSTKEIAYGTPKASVAEQLGKPLDRMRKDLVIFQLEENRDYDLYELDGNYVTIFYDKHRDNTVTSIQIISKSLEKQKESFYANASSVLKEGFEWQLFDITNAERVNHGVPVLEWDDTVKETARKHSSDMAENNYFDHTNLQGLSPFDRMQADEVSFMLAGENLASGQFSSIFAHEGLMNSLGHRKNILRRDYEFLGVGVAFNSKSQPYYTENFYAN
ncbi:CAP-associated domain-containing protein [Cytobacillus firmus]|uniref:CAP domain-containing protein n=1 Tax=Cytobacillus firmus TaxID=1399 RepID=UPI0024C12C26|nr:CAP-associated domain-containing protein [Cytobacillus firmus]WHY64136.1 CAP-associated domain-containing protein [Cytobacillus firmus]